MCLGEDNNIIRVELRYFRELYPTNTWLPAQPIYQNRHRMRSAEERRGQETPVVLMMQNNPLQGHPKAYDSARVGACCPSSSLVTSSQEKRTYAMHGNHVLTKANEILYSVTRNRSISKEHQAQDKRLVWMKKRILTNMVNLNGQRLNH